MAQHGNPFARSHSSAGIILVVASTPCEWPQCREPGTHTVTIDFPGEPTETWIVCRAHERALKHKAVASRPKAEPAKEQPTPIEVFCGDCRSPLDERSDLRVEWHQPCPKCGSLKRHVEVGVFDSITMHESVRVQSRTPSEGGWMVDIRTGDDYTRMLEGWGHRELTKDRQGDHYRELIELHDGTRIESVARLADHHD